jgi:hypothetical protein
VKANRDKKDNKINSLKKQIESLNKFIGVMDQKKKKHHAKRDNTRN